MFSLLTSSKYYNDFFYSHKDCSDYKASWNILKIYIKSKVILDFSCDLLIKYTVKNINTSYAMIQG